MPRTSALSSLSATNLHREIARRKGSVKSLVAKRDRLLAKASKIESQMAEFGVAAGTSVRTGGVRKRPKNDSTLPEALAKVLKGKTMGVAEVAEAVQKAGYKSNAANFTVMVNMNLTKHPKLFKRVERGQYTAK